jgi:phenylacetate-CoA ligase
MGPEELGLWQRDRLYILLSHARDTTDFYRCLIPRDFPPEESIEILKRLPVLTKQQIRANQEAFISNAFLSSKLYRGTTSGSTGTPFTFWMDRGRRDRQRAEIVFFGRWAGYEVGMRYLYLTADPKHPLHRWVQNEIPLDPTYLTDRWLEQLRDILCHSGAQMLISHPSPLVAVAQECLHRGESWPNVRLRAVICLGEPLMPHERSLIERTLGCPVFCRYSAREAGVIAGECEVQQYHINVGSLYLEYLDLEREQPVESGPARVVVTDLFNYGMLLIRYDIEDVVVLSSGRCPCGRPSPRIREVQGRMVEIITTPAGVRVDPLQICDALRDAVGVQQFQFIQLPEGTYRVKIVPDRDCSEELIAEIVQRYQKILGRDASVEVQTVAQIDPLPSGKRPLVLRARSAGP